ncbi:hypothetical protein KTR66_09815 [Roseococcus sp. SDR]|uniref:hypothetical protein n=1 Tax=Roseococcus sp. SDR TaxID=2835532 RepID=UPI001BCF150C|nr:hypothetical protein [Roseococcus sp. SDR]MBS7790293.1 hypothetical protein [Roseococcus sp. SDR]MBV1845607.1 hypothetical protein [Roseococcus sp. SDR]
MNANTKHTPGPWAVSDGGVFPAIWDADGRHLATMSDCGDEMEANAQMMAAAPDLLAALRVALDHMQASIETCRRAPHDIAAARAAIAKAEGR